MKFLLKKFTILAIFTLLFSLIVISYRHSFEVKSATNHVVISEIQISGDGDNPSDDEFVELYNPNDSAVVMENWRLTRKNSSGTQANLVSDLDGTIPPHGFFLIVNGDGYNGGATGDMSYSAPSNEMTNNYTAILYSDAGVTIVDKVGFGTAFDPETTATTNPSTGESIERKACSDSTSESMNNGESTSGNAEDTDNNANDFVSRTTPDPQNSSSTVETPSCEQPTETPTETGEPTPTEEVTPTDEPTPTQEDSPTPTEESTPTPTEEVTPTETQELTPTEAEATPTDFVEPSPTTEPSPTITPIPTPQSQIIGSFNFFNSLVTCRINFRAFSIGFFKFYMPFVNCSRS